MKAYTPDDLNARIAESNKEDWESIQRRIQGREASRKYAPLLKRLGFFYESRIYTFGPNPIIQIEVDAIKDCEPALAMIEDECGVTFDRSQDSTWSAERQFSATDLDFRLDVHVRADSPHCKRVIVGYEQVPKYELQCDDDLKDEGHPEQVDDPSLPREEDIII